MKRVIHKVAFGKSKHFISISYTEGSDDKVLECNEVYSGSFKRCMNEMMDNLQAYLGWDKYKMIVRVCDNITFATAKGMPKVVFSAVLLSNFQRMGIGITIDKTTDADEVNGEEPSKKVMLINSIENVRRQCENYLDGEREQGELVL